MKSLFEIDNISKVYKKGKVKANENISFQIFEGEIIGLLGPNGAGKSTLIKQMVAHLSPSEGEVRFHGKNVLKQAKKVSQHVSFYAQEPYSLTTLKVLEALVYTGRLRGLGKEEAINQAESLISRFELQDVKHKLVKNISGGQKRLVGIGTTLIGNCPVLILDEPTNELDPKKRRIVWDLLKERNKQGTTILLVTHNILEAEQVVDRVAVINHGKLLAIDHVSKLKQKVDQRLRLEVTLQNKGSKDDLQILERIGIVQKVTDRKLRVLVDKQDLNHLVKLIEADTNFIQEFSLVPPSLEDVYFHIDQDQKEEVV